MRSGLGVKQIRLLPLNGIGGELRLRAMMMTVRRSPSPSAALIRASHRRGAPRIVEKLETRPRHLPRLCGASLRRCRAATAHALLIRVLHLGETAGELRLQKKRKMTGRTPALVRGALLGVLPLSRTASEPKATRWKRAEGNATTNRS